MSEVGQLVSDLVPSNGKCVLQLPVNNVDTVVGFPFIGELIIVNTLIGSRRIWKRLKSDAKSFSVFWTRRGRQRPNRGLISAPCRNCNRSNSSSSNRRNRGKRRRKQLANRWNCSRTIVFWHVLNLSWQCAGVSSRTWSRSRKDFNSSKLNGFRKEVCRF